jgi:hypothetical protein
MLTEYAGDVRGESRDQPKRSSGSGYLLATIRCSGILGFHKCKIIDTVWCIRRQGLMTQGSIIGSIGPLLRKSANRVANLLQVEHLSGVNSKLPGILTQTGTQRQRSGVDSS